MATTNPTAVKKTLKGLTNQKTLTSIFKKFHKVEKLSYHNCKDCDVRDGQPDFHRYHNDCETESIDLCVAIMENREAKDVEECLVKWLNAGFRIPKRLTF
jgi:hypothetical protein